MKRYIGLTALTFALSFSAWAGPADFKTGPVIEGYGPIAIVPDAMRIPDTMRFKIAFDSAKPSEAGGVNRTLESAARFINMHAAAGVDPDRINVAVIVHGGAATDLLKDKSFASRREDEANPNAPLIKALTDKGVRVILCGQTAAYRNIETDELLPNVELALSAMTAHAQLQQDGYTLNPF